MRTFLCVAVALSSAAAFAQSDLNGQNQYPQFRTFSGLPGALMGIDHKGNLVFRGAMAISTPIAYSLGRGKFSFGVSNTSDSPSRITVTTKKGEAEANGTAWGLVGLSSPVGNFSVGGMVLSRIGDSVLNLHFQPRISGFGNEDHDVNYRRVDFGIGVQDTFNTGSATGAGLAKQLGTSGNSQSFYLVATTQINDNCYASLGTGTQRFRGLWGNVSYGLGRRLKALGEYDSFNFNYGLAYDLTNTSNFEANLFLGHIRGKYLTWGLSVGF